MAPLRILSVIVLAAVCACSGYDKSAAPAGGGTLVISTAGDPNTLLPPIVNTTQARQVTDLVYDRLASLGDSLSTIGDGGFIPALASSWTWSPDSLRISFHLNPKARWHDGTPVTAADVRFTFISYRDSALASPSASLLSGIDSVTAPDSLTAVFWFRARTPEQFYDATDNMSILPQHIWAPLPIRAWRTSEQSSRPVGSGQYRFESWHQGESLTLVADSANYRGPPKLDRLVWSIAPDFNTASARFFGGQTDFFEGLRVDDVPQVSKRPDLKAVAFPGIEYSFLFFNERDPKNPKRPHPLFADRELRRALTLAVDRASIVRSVYDSLALPVMGPALRAFPTTARDIPQIPFDLEAAKKKLDSLGWRSAPDGIREKGGRALSFTILVPSSSKTRGRMAVIIQNQLARVGADVLIEQVEFPTFIDRSDKHSFDALVSAIHSDPSPSAARQDWTTSGITGGNNSGSYSNPAFDAVVDSALATRDDATRRALFSRAYRLIIDDAPAIWLAEPKALVGIHRRIRVVGLRPDAWWQHVAEWWIPDAERIQRDLVTTRSPAPPTDSQRKTP